MELKDLFPTVITLILIGLLLGIGIFILSNIENNLDSTKSGTISNESISKFNASVTSVTLAAASLYRDGACGTITAVRNGTTGGVITSGNYTQTGCVVTNLTSTYITDSWLVSYPWTSSSDTEASTAINQTISGIGDFADWIPIIVVVIAAAIVLGIVLSSFGRREPGV